MATGQVLMRRSKSAKDVYSPSCCLHRNKYVFKDLRVCFCNLRESEKVWITGRLVGHCTASHCIGLYKEITLKWPKSPFAPIYRDGMWAKCDAGRWSKSRARISGRTKFLCSSLSSAHSSSKCSFSLCVSVLRLSLSHCTQQQVCANVSIALHVLCVLLLSVCCCDAAVSYRGVLLVTKWTKFHALDTMEIDFFCLRMFLMNV